MKCYRIYTEDMNEDDLKRMVSNCFLSFTIFKAVGFWQGNQEKSLVIETMVMTDGQSVPEVFKLAREIKKFNSQESVLITVFDLETYFV